MPSPQLKLTKRTKLMWISLGTGFGYSGHHQNWWNEAQRQRDFCSDESSSRKENRERLQPNCFPRRRSKGVWSSRSRSDSALLASFCALESGIDCHKFHGQPFDRVADFCYIGTEQEAEQLRLSKPHQINFLFGFNWQRFCVLQFKCNLLVVMCGRDGEAKVGIFQWWVLRTLADFSQVKKALIASDLVSLS